MNLHVPACRLVGKVGADNSHKWVFRDNATESDPNLISSWNSSIEPVRDFFFFHLREKNVSSIQAFLSFPLHSCTATSSVGVSISIRHSGYYSTNLASYSTNTAVSTITSSLSDTSCCRRLQSLLYEKA